MVFDSLIDQAPCGFLIFHDDGRIKSVNETLAAMLGLQKEELAGMQVEHLLTLPGRIFYQTHFFPLIRLHGAAEEIFLSLLSSEKTEVPVLINAKRLEVEGIHETHCILVSVPQRKKYEAELIEARRKLEHLLSRNELLLEATKELEYHKAVLDRQVTRLSLINKDLTQFSNVISHDIQEPIRKIAMFADIILRENEKELSQISQTSLRKIKAGSQRMRDLIASLQQYVSVESDSSFFSSCNLTEIVSRARLNAMADTRFRSIDLRSAALPVVSGHAPQLSLMFYHLVTNAVHFRDPGKGHVVIRVDAEIIQQNSFRSTRGKYKYIDFARIRFSDNGLGFDERYKEYIFQLFKKVHTDTPGLGFGLALCRKIAENHFGSISASSVIGHGTTFTILLPVRQSEEEPVPALT